MRLQFIRDENATLADSLRALVAARGWSAAEERELLARLNGAEERVLSARRDGAAAVAEAAGTLSAGPCREISDEFARSPAYRAARDRIQAAALGHRIILFGDYDADGITAVAQMHRFLSAAGHQELSWFVPDRMRHGYGLTAAAVEECLATCREEWARRGAAGAGAARARAAGGGVAQAGLTGAGMTGVGMTGHGVTGAGISRSGSSGRAPARIRSSPSVASGPPILLISLDCGSASTGLIAELQSRGIDCLVVDHHQPHEQSDAAHPAVAHCNPHAWGGDSPALSALRDLSAAGLAYFLCRNLAHDLGVTRWEGEAALVLAGLGTVADVVPLRGPNRDLVKAALRQANQPGFLTERMPGLAALHELSGGGVVDARAFGYRWGPRVNASGRIEEARQPVALLLADDPAKAAELARACDHANEERKSRTAEMLEDAMRLAEEREQSGARDRVLVLWDESWEPGIVGIVAGRMRERTGLPTIILGKHRGHETWKGSGRSVSGYDLGTEVRRAVEAGLALNGGGHHQAAGLTVAAAATSPDHSPPSRPAKSPAAPCASLETLRDWLNERCQVDARAVEPSFEILAPIHAPASLVPVAQSFRDPNALVRFWCDLYDCFEPFGAGNPRPGLLARNAELVLCQEKTTLKGTRTFAQSAAGTVTPVPRVWAISARFRLENGESILADWTDPEAARAVWPGPSSSAGGAGTSQRYNLVLEPHRSVSPGRGGAAPRTWYDWRVVACEALPS